MNDTESDAEEEEEDDENMNDDDVCDPNASKSPMSAVDSQESAGESETEESLDPALVFDRNPDDLSDSPDTPTTESGTTLILPGVKRTLYVPPPLPPDDLMSSDDEDQEGSWGQRFNSFGDGAENLEPPYRKTIVTTTQFLDSIAVY